MGVAEGQDTAVTEGTSPRTHRFGTTQNSLKLWAEGAS